VTRLKGVAFVCALVAFGSTAGRSEPPSARDRAVAAIGHCGVDAFDLVETPEGWKIAGGVYTVEMEGCAPSPLGAPTGPEGGTGRTPPAPQEVTSRPGVAGR
jgi:hypothetical protein